MRLLLPMFDYRLNRESMSRIDSRPDGTPDARADRRVAWSSVSCLSRRAGTSKTRLAVRCNSRCIVHLIRHCQGTIP